MKHLPPNNNADIPHIHTILFKNSQPTHSTDINQTPEFLSSLIPSFILASSHWGIAYIVAHLCCAPHMFCQGVSRVDMCINAAPTNVIHICTRSNTDVCLSHATRGRLKTPDFAGFLPRDSLKVSHVRSDMLVGFVSCCTGKCDILVWTGLTKLLGRKLKFLF